MTKQLGLWCPDRDGGSHQYLIDHRRPLGRRRVWMYLCSCGERFTVIERRPR